MINSPVDIQVIPKFEHKHSNFKKQQFVYSYQITIKNTSQSSLQLMSRRWLITDSNGAKKEVRGDGVIGEQPIIESGKSYSYSSNCVLETPAGTMEGHYLMRTDQGEELNTPIKPFLLSIPELTLH